MLTRMLAAFPARRDEGERPAGRDEAAYVAARPAGFGGVMRGGRR